MQHSAYDQAVKRVQAVKSFYIHLIFYVLVNFGLICINFIYSPEDKWFIYPLFGWGIGIISHGVSVFCKDLLFGKKWEEKQIEKYLKK